MKLIWGWIWMLTIVGACLATYECPQAELESMFLVEPGGMDFTLLSYEQKNEGPRTRVNRPAYKDEDAVSTTEKYDMRKVSDLNQYRLTKVVHLKKNCTTVDEPPSAASTCAYMLLKGLPSANTNMDAKTMLTYRERLFCILKAECYLHADIAMNEEVMCRRMDPTKFRNMKGQFWYYTGFLCCFKNYGKKPMQQTVQEFREHFALRKNGDVDLKSEVDKQSAHVEARLGLGLYFVIALVAVSLLVTYMMLAAWKNQQGKHKRAHRSRRSPSPKSRTAKEEIEEEIHIPREEPIKTEPEEVLSNRSDVSATETQTTDTSAREMQSRPTDSSTA